jgi:hypothetical protein
MIYDRSLPLLSVVVLLGDIGISLFTFYALYQ